MTSPTAPVSSESNSKGLAWRVREYGALVRFSHTVFALPFAVLAAILAWREAAFEWVHVVGVLICMVAARTAAMAFNRLADHRLDADNPRTAGRHLPAGVLSRREVTGLTLASSVAFVLGTLCFLPNRWPLYLAVPVLLWLCGYSFAKRFTSLAHYWLGIALGLAPVATWLAITGTVSPTPVWIAAVVVTWVGGFDILYACQDEEYDRGVDLHSIPAKLGRPGAFWVARLSHVLAVACLVGLWQSAGLGVVFAVGVGLIGVLLVVEHALVSPNDLSRVNAAFFTVNAIISFGLLAVTALDLSLGL